MVSLLVFRMVVRLVDGLEDEMVVEMVDLMECKMVGLLVTLWVCGLAVSLDALMDSKLVDWKVKESVALSDLTEVGEMAERREF